jgi:Domain of unknown function (DUF3303)
MLIKTEFTIRNPSEESLPRQLAVFAAWQPPEGMEIQGFYTYADGSGGFTIAEVPDAATAARALAAFSPWLDFELVPMLPVEEGVAIFHEGIAFRAGVS